MSWKGSVVASTYVVVVVFLCMNLLSFTMVSSQTPPPPQTCPGEGLRACVSLLNLRNTDYGGVNVNITVGMDQCCDLIEGLSTVQAAACICTAVKASVLGGNAVDIATGFSTTLGGCFRDNGGFQCT